jgi:DNA-directed RNA polymerase specialized sigma24 family protein
MSSKRKEQASFQVRFSRCYRLLHFIACCVLGGAERTEEVIERCRLRASLCPPRFEYEGAFRSWLLRVLIDEAVVVLRRSQEEAGGHDIVGEATGLEPAISSSIAVLTNLQPLSRGHRTNEGQGHGSNWESSRLPMMGITGNGRCRSPGRVRPKPCFGQPHPTRPLQPR